MHLLLGDREIDLTDRVVVLGPDDEVVRVVADIDGVAAVAVAVDGGTPVWWSAPGPTEPPWCGVAAAAVAAAGLDPAQVVLDDRLDLVDPGSLARRLRPGPPPPGPALAVTLPDGLDESALVASLVFAVRAGRRVVRTADPVAARRCLGVWEALHREQVGRFDPLGGQWGVAG